VLRSALFVDFDNIFLGLLQQDEAAAAEFAGQPSRWVRWMEHEMERPSASGGGFENRRLLMRRCYLNPQKFGSFRASFTRAGFEVVDCPQLTRQAKNSADIRIAMDVLDALEHRTRFDEFIILSSDSDFTPVLLRLRAFDRRTTVLTVGNVAGAYRSACDLTIESEDFLEKALSRPDAAKLTDPPGREQRVPFGDHELLRRIAHRVHDEASISGTLHPGALSPIYREFEEFRRGKSWLGYFGLRNLTEAVVATWPELQIVGDDDWVVAVKSVEDRDAHAIRASGSSNDLRHRIGELVSGLVAGSGEPIPMVIAANELRQSLGEEIDRTNWAGAGTFKGLLIQLALPKLTLSNVPPGYIYDVQRHDPPQPRVSTDDIAHQHPELLSIVRQVHQLTNVPDLAPEVYQTLYRFIADETDANGYSLTGTSKAVRDRCLAEDVNVSRNDVAFVLKGLVYSGVDFKKGEGANDPQELARIFSTNVIDLCENAGLSMTDEQREKINHWLAAES
ncbi:MAG: NYN domain-containing protein, partial [Candidatus Latescibacteria bacterium]|nr:NYN domain-containing protein [Candidatus Latescibacterota bacterium]